MGSGEESELGAPRPPLDAIAALLTSGSILKSKADGRPQGVCHGRGSGRNLLGAPGQPIQTCATARETPRTHRARKNRKWPASKAVMRFSRKRRRNNRERTRTGRRKPGPAGYPLLTVRREAAPLARSCELADDVSAPRPKYGEPIWRRRERRGVSDRRRSSSAFRTTP
jgi:hypothetical protein